MGDIIVLLKPPLNLLLKYFNKVIQKKIKKHKYLVSGRSQENIHLVRARVVKDPKLSISGPSPQRGHSETTSCILRTDLALKPEKIEEYRYQSH